LVAGWGTFFTYLSFWAVAYIKVMLGIYVKRMKAFLAFLLLGLYEGFPGNEWIYFLEYQ